MVSSRALHFVSSSSIHRGHWQFAHSCPHTQSPNTATGNLRMSPVIIHQRSSQPRWLATAPSYNSVLPFSLSPNTFTFAKYPHSHLLPAVKDLPTTLSAFGGCLTSTNTQCRGIFTGLQTHASVPPTMACSQAQKDSETGNRGQNHAVSLSYGIL